jgi:arginyl-tRNA synthetase
MTFRKLVSEAEHLISIGLSNLGHAGHKFELLDPPKPEFGDLSSNVAFELSKVYDVKPYQFAQEFVENYLRPIIRDEHEKGSLSMIASVEAHPGGYINFRTNNDNFSEITLSRALEDPRYGFWNVGEGRTVNLEHTSVNPNKALHVGHLRNVILGDVIYRILQFTNHAVKVLNYVDDSGLQVADIIVAFKFAGFPVEPPSKPMKFDRYCGDYVYVKVNELYPTNPSLVEKRRYILKELEIGQSEVAKFASTIVLRVLLDQLTTCWRMKAHYDLVNFESQIILSDLWERTFDLLKNKGLVQLAKEGKNAGCWIINPERASDQEKVIVRSDGTLTYIAKDIPYAAWKVGFVNDPFSYREFCDQWDNTLLWTTTLDISQDKSEHPDFTSADKAITVIDSRQSRLQCIISCVLSKFQQSDNIYLHLGYEPVSLSSRTAHNLGTIIDAKHSVQMSGRKGIQVNADDLIDLIKLKAYEEVSSRHPGYSKERLDMLAESIAVSAVRYNMIKYDLDKNIVFDITESINLDGDTGPYLQYAYARAQRILEKSSEKYFRVPFSKLNSEPEIRIIRVISKFDLVIENAARSLKPKILAKYVHTLATAFNVFYETTPVLKEDNREIRIARIALVNAFCKCLEVASALLGIQSLKEM